MTKTCRKRPSNVNLTLNTQEEFSLLKKRKAEQEEERIQKKEHLLKIKYIYLFYTNKIIPTMLMQNIRKC